MAAAFQAGSVEELEGEAARLIMSNQLQARIDSQNKTLHRRKVDRRDAGYLKVGQPASQPAILQADEGGEEGA